MVVVCPPVIALLSTPLVAAPAGRAFTSTTLTLVRQGKPWTIRGILHLGGARHITSHSNHVIPLGQGGYRVITVKAPNAIVYRGRVTKPFALLLLTVAEQSFAVSKLRACLLLPNDTVSLRESRDRDRRV